MHPDLGERRRHPRFNFRIPMRYRKIETTVQGFKGGLVRNISEGGICMTIYEFLPLNIRLALEVPLAQGTKPVQGVGRVAWVSKLGFSEQYQAGLEFVQLNQGDTFRINKFIFDKTVEKAL